MFSCFITCSYLICSSDLAICLGCLGKYEIAILAGGQSVQIPVVTVKGDLNIDRPPVGRGWLTNNDIDGPMMPASNVKVMHSNSRRFRNVFQHKKGWWNR